MDKKLLKYWKNCLLDAERRSRSLKKEARVTLRIGDKVPEFILRKDIPLLFPKGKQKTDDEKRKIQIAPCVFLPIIRKTKNSSFKNEKSKKEVDVTITVSNKDIV